MQTLVFATNNTHKVEEIRFVLKETMAILPLSEAGIDIEILEPHHTLEENATEKSRTIYALTGSNCFSEDSGLEVRELGGEPGVRSARYAGETATSEDNINLLLENLSGAADRRARFRTVISLILDNKEYTFEGICAGTITHLRSGNNGFGYDPVFIPDGSKKTFAEMELEEKNQYSHRKKATDQLVHFIKTQHGQDKN